MEDSSRSSKPDDRISRGIGITLKKIKIVGWTRTVLPVLMLLMSATMKFLMPKSAVEGFVHLGFPEKLAFGLGVLELICTILYLIPPTAVLGAILLPGYLGGAICTHLRVGDPVIMPVIIGVFVSGGLFQRESRLRALIPLRRAAPQ